ncbi:MAG: S1 family peptidase [Micrococcales bacterium]|nr:S1 family peptidase [Micrococcales bacterium]
MRLSWVLVVAVLALVAAFGCVDVSTARPGLAAAPESGTDVPLRAGKRVSGCTANFLVHKNGTSMNLAAGHCGGVGAAASLGSTNLGTVSVNTFSTGTDAAAFTVAGGASLTPSVFVSANLVRPVVGQANVVVGDRVCMRGASSGTEVCGTVRSVGVTLTYLNTTVSGLARVKLDGGPLIGGDSGAPVYKVGADGSAYAAGIAVLSDGTFTMISAALSATGTTLATKGGAGAQLPPPPAAAPDPPASPTQAVLTAAATAMTVTSAYGSPNDAASLGLPATATVTTDAGEKKLPVTWDPYATGYDLDVATEQTFTYHGLVQLPDDLANPANLPLDIEATVTVLAARALDAPGTDVAPLPPATAPTPPAADRSLPVALAASAVALVLTCAVCGAIIMRRRGLL